MPTHTPLVSVVIATRDRPALLRRALASALAQRDVAFEIVVADDGDGTGAAVARAIGGAAVAAFSTGRRGQAAARNVAIARARGRLVAFLDDDDWWAGPHHLAALAGCLGAAEGVAYASGRLVREGTDGMAVEELSFAAHSDPLAIRRDNRLLVSGIAYDRALHDRLGPLDETFAIYWDWDWYLRAAEAGVRFVASDTADVRISVRAGTASAADNLAVRQAELARLCARHDMRDIQLKNHETLALEQRGTAGASSFPRPRY